VQCTVAGQLVRWDAGESPFASAPFRSGWFVAQDPTALLAAEAVAAAPGEQIVDLCAAPGTKSTLLAERVQPRGQGLAFAVDPVRRARSGENQRRLRLYETLRIVDDAAALPVAAADAVLADVPCSNPGVLGRRVEVRARLRPSTFGELAAVQR